MPAIGTTEAKLQQRKLDALKRGVHRIADVQSLPFGVHLVSVGGAGARVVEAFLRDAPADLLDVPGSCLSVLAVDIGDHDLAGLRSLAAHLPADRTQIETLALDMPAAAALQDTLTRYPDFLKLEYPLTHWNAGYGPWLPADAELPAAGATVPRALAKAVYGQAFYDGERPAAAALRRFARQIEAHSGSAVVCIVFGLGGGTGSGIALDLARHLSSGLFGRRVLVTGIGLAPHADDRPEARGAQLFTTLAELDVLCDEDKNRGVTQSCGDLFKNPFTAGFVVVPAQDGSPVAVSRQRSNREVASLLMRRRGANLWEALRLLNWVAAPSTQHSAARTPWGARWLHLFGFDDLACTTATTDLPARLGLLPGYVPEFIELRAAEGADASATAAWAETLDRALEPEVPTHKVAGGEPGSVQFMLPRLAKIDLALFHRARQAYDALDPAARLAAHALLLEQGVLLCEPSARLPGMAGAPVGASQQWVAVPLDALRGDAYAA